MVARLTDVGGSVQLLGDNGCSVVQLTIPHLNIDEYQNTTFSKFTVANAKCKTSFVNLLLPFSVVYCHSSHTQVAICSFVPTVDSA